MSAEPRPLAAPPNYDEETALVCSECDGRGDLGHMHGSRNAPTETCYESCGRTNEPCTLCLGTGVVRCTATRCPFDAVTFDAEHEEVCRFHADHCCVCQTRLLPSHDGSLRCRPCDVREYGRAL